jgi:hypothetical protein
MSSDPSGGRSISSELATADRPYCHSGIFFSHAKIFSPLGSYYQRAWSDLAIATIARRQNYNELSVLPVFSRIGKLVALALFMMRLILEALFFRAARM